MNSSEELTITKADIVEQVYNKIGFSKKDATDFVELFFSLMKTSLCDGEDVKISGFGNFVVNQKKERMGRNPQTGEKIAIKARRVIGFKPSQVFKGNLNNK
ncbi:MAG: integration host factor subunit alpha [Bdellovibrionaceae bacterium]|nr:integration host factor subunit alpha [Pseudobdellovibrionaceae bacterium]